jgi:hypothetical protein
MSPARRRMPGITPSSCNEHRLSPGRQPGSLDPLTLTLSQREKGD